MSSYYLFVVLLLQTALFTAVLGITIFIGGIGSAINGANVQNVYIDGLDCPVIERLHNPFHYPLLDALKKLCHKLDRLRHCQIAAAVSCGTYILMYNVS